MSQPLRILHVFPGFGVGGAQMRFVALAKGLGADFSHDVVSLSGERGAQMFLTPDMPVAQAEAPSDAGSLVARLGRYRRTIRERAPNLLVTYNWGAIEWALANDALKTPHVHIEDGFGPEESRRQFPRRVWARRLALRRSTLVVPSRTLEEVALGIWHLRKASVRYIPNGIEPRDHFLTRLKDLDLQLPPDRPLIAWAGALRREKNLSRMLRAFAPLKREATLLIIGDGPEMAAARTEAEHLSITSSVRFLGRRQDVRDILMQCDILALSSDTEQMPLAVLEAMDAALPVVSTAVGDVKYMVCEENGPYIVQGSAQELGAALRTLVADKAVRRTIGVANQRRLRQDFAARDMIAAYRDLFRECAGKINKGLRNCA
jgi:glycosyltransferase involved in cell wall biosynthesis